jgi:hypothetical protein
MAVFDMHLKHWSEFEREGEVRSLEEEVWR